MQLSTHLQQRLTRQLKKRLVRKRRLIENNAFTHSKINKQSCINFCSNDYLNISHHAVIKKAFIRSIHQHGVGSGASPLLSGYSKPHQQLEETVAEFLNRDKALLFNSGYHANLGVITTFANRNSMVLADKLCHASLIDGIVLSRSRHYRYHHQDDAHAENLIKKYRHHADQKNALLIITEGVFSIYGDIGHSKKLAELTEQAHGMLVIDDAHGIGILGKNGKGICEHHQLSQADVPCLITPFGKALGSFGAVVSGKKQIIEPLMQFARTLHYSTALPPALCDATRAAIYILQTESWRREQLHSLIKFFIKASHERYLPLISADKTPIKAFHVNSNQQALLMQKKLLEKGFFVACIRSPTVPPQSACLRLSLNCLHTEAHIIQLLDYLREQYHAFSND